MRNLQLEAKGIDVHADSPRADAQVPGDFAIRAPSSHKSENLELAF